MGSKQFPAKSIASPGLRAVEYTTLGTLRVVYMYFYVVYSVSTHSPSPINNVLSLFSEEFVSRPTKPGLINIS